MKTRKLLSSLFYSMTVVISALGLAPAFADNPSGSGASAPYTDDATAYASVTACQTNNSIGCLISGYGYNYANLLFLPGYQQANSMLTGSILQFILMPSPMLSLAYGSNISQSILTLISNKGNTASSFLGQTPSIFANGIVLSPAASPASDLLINLPPAIAALFYAAQATPTEAEQQSAINTLNLNSLMVPVVYNIVPVGNGAGNANQVNQSLVANAFIQYVTGLSNPFQPADFTSMKLPSNYSSPTAYLYYLETQQQDVINYLTALRNYTAQMSVGISNYYYLYNERMPIQDPILAAKAVAAMTPPPGSALSPSATPTGPVSPLAVEQFLATRRVNDSGWYLAMQNALPSTLLRESLFLLAEIPPMLFQIHLDLERILATTSATEIQQTSGSTLLLGQARDKVNQLLQNPQQSQSSAGQAASQATQQANQAEMQQAAQAVSGSTGTGP